MIPGAIQPVQLAVILSDINFSASWVNVGFYQTDLTLALVTAAPLERRRLLAG